MCNPNVAYRFKFLLQNTREIQVDKNWTELNQEALDHMQRGELPKAIHLTRHALDMAIREHGEEYPTVGIILNNLGELCRMGGDLQEAEKALLKAAQIIEKVNGATSAEVAETLNNIANMYMESHRWQEAQPLMERVVNIYEKIQVT